MQQCDDLSGLQDGYTAKMLHPAAPSGRQASWSSLQLLLDAIYPQGYRLTIRPLPVREPRLLECFGKHERRVQKGHGSWQRHLDFIEISGRGGRAAAKTRMEKLPPRRRS